MPKATYSPRRDVTIVRDRAFGVPHVYGRTRSGAMAGTTRSASAARAPTAGGAEALKLPPGAVYRGDAVCKAGDQLCWDAIRQRPTGGATQPLIEWINRPTFQQANEIQHRVPR